MMTGTQGSIYTHSLNADTLSRHESSNKKSKKSNPKKVSQKYIVVTSDIEFEDEDKDEVSIEDQQKNPRISSEESSLQSNLNS